MTEKDFKPGNDDDIQSLQLSKSSGSKAADRHNHEQLDYMAPKASRSIHDRKITTILCYTKS